MVLILRVNNWHEEENNKRPDFLLPKGEMKAIGYLCQQHSIRLDRPVKSYTKWLNRIPMGQESRKPIFSLTSADGAIGAHVNALQSAKADFKELALKIAAKIGLNTPLEDKPTPYGISQPHLV